MLCQTASYYIQVPHNLNFRLLPGSCSQETARCSYNLLGDTSILQRILQRKKYRTCKQACTQRYELGVIIRCLPWGLVGDLTPSELVGEVGMLWPASEPCLSSLICECASIVIASGDGTKKSAPMSISRLWWLFDGMSFTETLGGMKDSSWSGSSIAKSITCPLFSLMTLMTSYIHKTHQCKRTGQSQWHWAQNQV